MKQHFLYISSSQTNKKKMYLFLFSFLLPLYKLYNRDCGMLKLDGEGFGKFKKNVILEKEDVKRWVG